ncbi:MAG: class I SAM-dependent methyltransferase [Treponemataceae bacterium]
MYIKSLDGIWNSAFGENLVNMYDDPKAASDYDSSKTIREDGIKRAEAFNFPGDYCVLDIGAGPGILSVPLSKKVKKVTAVEPSLEMVKFLERHISEEKIKNIDIINRKWQEVEFDNKFDAVIASYSLLMKDISDVILKMNKASKKHCYIFWFSGSTSWEDEEKQINKILGKEFKPRLNKVNIIYQILYELKLYPDVKVLKDVRFNRCHKTLEQGVDFIKTRYKIQNNLYDDKILKYIKSRYKKNVEGYTYIDNTNYTEVHWTV